MKCHSNYIAFFIYSIAVCAQAEGFKAPKTKQIITIDGIASEIAWNQSNWYPIDKLILGVTPTQDDFHGRFRMLWDEEKLYLQAEIVDDVLFDQHANPLFSYWDDDCLEIFIDEDKSGGDHQFNFNAFAYHVALDNQIVDIGETKQLGINNFITLNDHIHSKWQRSEKSPHKIIWEVAISVYDDTYQHPNLNKTHQPVKLTANKELGFMLAYCDNDGSQFRESFVGSTRIAPVNGDKNLGYKTADVFDTLILIDSEVKN